MLEKSFPAFQQAIKGILDESQIITDKLQRYAFGTDASFYRLVPKLVINIDNEQQLIDVMKASYQYCVPVTFRAAGTSLSGQAITDSVLIILSHEWSKIDILEKGKKIRLQPGVIGAHANRTLASYDRKIGPDPASINSCKIGGIAANNSSGMCCGVKNNSYHTMADMRIVMANGSVLDTANLLSREQFLRENPKLIAEISALAENVKKTPELAVKIAHKYRLKNTMGYGVNALLEYTDPIDIISHLMIGSEGTLGFISDITYHTIEIEPFSAVGLFVFDDIQIVCELVHKLATESVSAIELMDGTALNSVTDKLKAFISVEQLSHRHAGLLIEVSSDTSDELVNKLALIEQHITDCGSHLIAAQKFTQSKENIEKLWAIRKGMFPAVGAARTTGTTIIIEDVALPLEHLANGVDKLHQLFQQYNYHDAIIFGHALDGNLHFVFSQSFEEQKEIERYSQFMRSVSNLIAIDFQGSLKAEHGTGRNMAPFVEMEWGEHIYKVMQSIKSAFDPLNILNPGVIINDNANAHLLDLKSLPQSDNIIDKCIECGFCESVCPSKNYTLTPRQRIAVWRHISDLKARDKRGKLSEKQQLEYKELAQSYQFFGIDSCAATGLCAHQCPVGIDTGKFIHTLRERNNQSQWAQQLSAKYFDKVLWGANKAVTLIAKTSRVLGPERTKMMFKWLNKLSYNKIPLWQNSWPNGASRSDLKQAHSSSSGEKNNQQASKVVFISSCTNRVFATDENAQDQRSLITVLSSVLAKANIELIIPNSIDALCCGKPWLSKGNEAVADQKAQQLIDAVNVASENGRWPVVIDASPCALTLSQLKQSRIFELSDYLLTSVVPSLSITKTAEPIMLHKTCSSIQQDGAKALTMLTELCCDNVIIPNDINCCGFAGDKGFFLPELNKAALGPLSDQVPKNCQRGVSNSRTCEIGLSQHSGIPYQSIIYLLDEVSESA
ncbi:FAD-binding and (Fe-S)-binding domain-containing protein [Thalassotalea sp. PP2-459]|uniref:FAD-binding and (Fe-S)-binding domain-containing protein n=1 Tax=Thalassotalea sp. PP2-459 TaxID=1742724 RepID=UPI0009424629|nr:FAD-binding and (Fe-S)-binding domain-containing protein [Thalassotalea sp. PP2-459]OKY25195.1 4Fe-4S ferredoxin [Thalassotalea sp. PP2-459]